MPLRACLILIVAMLSLAPTVYGQSPPAAPAAAPPDPIPPVRPEQSRRIATFGPWSIRLLPEYNSHLLVGEATNVRRGEFWLQCDQRGLMTIAIPMHEKSNRAERLRSQSVKVTLDDAPPRAMDFIVFANYVAIAMGYETKGEDRVSLLLNEIGNAKKKLALTYDETTLNFDVTELPRAKARFMELCKQSAR